MKKSDIEASLAALQKTASRLKTLGSELNDAQRDRNQLKAAVVEIGEPSYKDDAAILRLSTANKKIELCERTIARLSDQMAELIVGQANARIDECAPIVATLLEGELDRRRETIATVLVPFCESADEANEVAEQTSSYAVGAAKRRFFCSMTTNLHMNGIASLPEVSEALAKIEAVLTGYLKDSANLQKFIAFYPPCERESRRL